MDVFLEYLREWDRWVESQTGLSKSDKARLKLSQETILGWRMTGAVENFYTGMVVIKAYFSYVLCRNDSPSPKFAWKRRYVRLERALESRPARELLWAATEQGGTKRQPKCSAVYAKFVVYPNPRINGTVTSKRKQQQKAPFIS